MGVFPVDKLAVGMVLASDVKDPFGRTLMNSGQELQVRHIEVLRAYNIVEIDISGSESIDHGIDDGEIDQEAVTAAEAKLQHAFSRTDLSWDVMKQIHRSAVMHCAKDLNRNGRSS
ncbi:MAG: hypothetical protein ACOYNS_02425 [Bacteroidota bacterium]